MHSRTRNCMHCIIPPYIFEKILETGDSDDRKAALDALTRSAELRGERTIRRREGASALAATSGGRRTIFDCQNSWTTFGAVLARSEDGAPSNDDSVNRLFDGLGVTRDFFRTQFDRNSLDGNGLRLDGYVHFGVKHQNA